MNRQLQRAWAFGRHIPPGKLARRLWLAQRRRIDDRRGTRKPPRPDVHLKQDLPAPLFPPRILCKIQREGVDWVFCFLGRVQRFYDGRIDWMAPGSGAEHQLWRMNLHYMEYLEEVDDADFADLVSAWLRDNASLQPGAWRDGWNAYALSIRVVVWLQQLPRRSGRLDSALVAAMEDSLARQMSFLVRNLETDIGGNHLIKNIKALLWAGAAFEGAAARSWQALGRRLLMRELKVQILPDGVHYERSPAYHAQVFADLLECRVIMQSPLPALDAVLERMAQATADLAHPDGLAAQFNDAGLHMAYDPATCLGIYVKQFGTRPQPQDRFAYEAAGYFGYRDDRLTVIVDCGALAPDDLPAHGHGDILSFELSLEGRRMIVDQGVFEYIPGPRRDVSRAAASHNTLAVKGADQADFFGAFRFGRRARITERHWLEVGDTVTLTGVHDGYAILPGAPRHRRSFRVGPNGLILSDRLEGSASPPAAWAGLLLHPEIRPQALSEGGWQLEGPERQVLRIFCSATLELEEAVWWPDMGHELLTRRLVARARAGDGEIETIIEVLPASAGPRLSKVQCS